MIWILYYAYASVIAGVHLSMITKLLCGVLNFAWAGYCAIQVLLDNARSVALLFCQ
jgi:hypothetical protein